MIIRLIKSHDVSAEARVPVGSKGAGRWTSGGAPETLHADLAALSEDGRVGADEEFERQYRTKYLPGLSKEGLAAEYERVKAKAASAKPNRVDYWKSRLAWIAETEHHKGFTKPAAPSPPVKPAPAPPKAAAPTSTAPPRQQAVPTLKKEYPPLKKEYPPLKAEPDYMQAKASDAAIDQYKATLQKMGVVDGGITGAAQGLRSGGYETTNDDGYRYKVGGRKVTPIQAQRRAAAMAKNALVRLNQVVKIDANAFKGRPPLRIKLNDNVGDGYFDKSERVAATYSNVHNEIQLDSQSPTSLFHEYGHYLDYAAASRNSRSAYASAASVVSPEWTTFVNDLARTDSHINFLRTSGHRASYAADPKEIFARFFETYVVHELRKKGVDGDAYTLHGHRNRSQGGFFTEKGNEQYNYEELDRFGSRLKKLLRSSGLLKTFLDFIGMFNQNRTERAAYVSILAELTLEKAGSGKIKFQPAAITAAIRSHGVPIAHRDAKRGIRRSGVSVTGIGNRIYMEHHDHNSEGNGKEHIAQANAALSHYGLASTPHILQGVDTGLHHIHNAKPLEKGGHDVSGEALNDAALTIKRPMLRLHLGKSHMPRILRFRKAIPCSSSCLTPLQGHNRAETTGQVGPNGKIYRRGQFMPIYKSIGHDVTMEARAPRGTSRGGQWIEGHSLAPATSPRPSPTAGGGAPGRGLPQVTDKEREHAKAAGAIVPKQAWGLRINVDPAAKVLAAWYDAKGREQTFSSAAAVAERGAKRFDDLRKFQDSLPKLRSAVKRDLADKGPTVQRACAAIVALIDATAIRVGGEGYAEENGTYGASSLRKDHVEVSGDQVKINFVGKHHKEHEKIAVSPSLAAAMKEFLKIPGDRVFQALGTAGKPISVDEQKVRDYLKPFGVRPHQFRAYHATQMAHEMLDKMGPPKDEKAARAGIT